MEKRSTRLDSLIKLAAHEEQDAVQHFAQAQRNYQRQQDYLHELERYKEEYSVSMNTKTNVTLNAVSITQHRQFLDQIYRGIEHQRNVLEDAKNNVEETKRVWTEKYNRKRALERAKERFSDAEVLEEVKMSQKIQDEHASRGGRKTWDR